MSKTNKNSARHYLFTFDDIDRYNPITEFVRQGGSSLISFPSSGEVGSISGTVAAGLMLIGSPPPPV